MHVPDPGPSGANQPGANATFYIRQASTAADMIAIGDCFREYTEWLGLDLTFQDYASETKDLPSKYASSSGGALLLARDDVNHEVLGCIALRPLLLKPEYLVTPNRLSKIFTYCEIKRLYVRPAGRRRGIASALVREVLAVARAQGYHEALLDTLGTMNSAAALYRSEGFIDIKPYYHNPLSEVVFLAKVLDEERHHRARSCAMNAVLQLDA